MMAVMSTHIMVLLNGQSKEQANSIADIIIRAQKLRVHYLQKQLSAVIAHARALSGEQKLTFDAQSLALYDT